MSSGACWHIVSKTKEKLLHLGTPITKHETQSSVRSLHVLDTRYSTLRNAILIHCPSVPEAYSFEVGSEQETVLHQVQAVMKIVMLLWPQFLAEPKG